MDLIDFKKTLSANEPPKNINDDLLAMWYDAKGDWEKAHQLVQDSAGKNASWIHAYLHRKERDISNADYWYSKAGKIRPALSLEKEWEQIVSEL